MPSLFKINMKISTKKNKSYTLIYEKTHNTY